MKQIHKNVVLSRTKTVNNILRIWNLSQPEDRYDWYTEAYKFALSVSEVTGLTINQVAGVIAALSPLKTWEQNKIQAMQMIKTGNCGHMKAFKGKAAQIIASNGNEEGILKILKGSKITSFYLNIRYPDKSINLTIDRHALSVCLGRWVSDLDYSGMTVKQYQFFSDCYRHAAARLNVSPLLVQSATWVVWRRIKREY